LANVVVGRVKDGAALLVPDAPDVAEDIGTSTAALVLAPLSSYTKMLWKTLVALLQLIVCVTPVMFCATNQRIEPSDVCVVFALPTGV
jgi:hypothetical protein